MKSIMTLGAVLALPALVFGASGYTLTVGGSGTGGPTAITVNPGDSFTLDLGITQESDGVIGFDGALQASVNNTFYLTARTWHLDEVDVTVVDATFLDDANKWLKATVERLQNFGAIHASDFWPASVFPTAIATFAVVTSATATPGVYTITVGDPGTTVAIYDSSVEAQTPLSIGVFTVTVQGDSGGGGGGGDPPPDDDDPPPDDDLPPDDDTPPDDEGTPPDDSTDDTVVVDPDGGSAGGSDSTTSQDGSEGSLGSTDNNPQKVPAPLVCGPGVGGGFVLTTMLGLGLIGRRGRRN